MTILTEIAAQLPDNDSRKITPAILRGVLNDMVSDYGTVAAAVLATAEAYTDAHVAGFATTTFVNAAVAALVNSAPATLDTLKELADALGDDQNFATTVTNALALKAPLANPSFTGAATIAGGTVAANAPPLSATQTWNNAAVNFKGISLNVTNTASGPGSRLIDLTCGNLEFLVTGNGEDALYGQGIGLKSDSAISTNFTLNNTSAGGHSLQFFSTGASNTPGQFGIYDLTARSGSGRSLLTLDGNTGNVQWPRAGIVGWSTDANFTTAGFDVALARSAAGVLEVNNGTLGTFADMKLRKLAGSSLAIGGAQSLLSGTIATLSANAAALQPMPGFSGGTDDPQLLVGGADAKRGFIAVQSFQNGRGAESSVCLFTANGTAAVPASTVSGDFVAEFFGHGYTTLGGTPGFVYSSGAGYIVRATENYTATASGAALDFWGTPTAKSVCELFATLQDGNLTISPSSSPLASGIQHSISINGARAGVGGGSALYGFNPTDGALWGIGHASAILSTAYDPTCLIHSATAAYRFNGLTAGTLQTSSNGTVSVTPATIDNVAWTTYTPVVTPAGGAITAYTATGRWKKIGKTVYVETDVVITTVGTASGNMIVTLPTNSAAFRYSGVSFDYGATFKSGAGYINGGTDATKFQTADASGNTLFAASAKVVSSFTYEAA